MTLPTIRPTVEELAYVAGFIDGEGCVHGHWAMARGSKVKIGTARLTVGSTNLDVLLFCQKLFGGSISKRDIPRPRATKVSWAWCIGSQATVRCLEMILPYLIVKRPEAEVAIELGKYVRPRGHVPLSEDELKARALLVVELFRLKRAV